MKRQDKFKRKMIHYEPDSVTTTFTDEECREFFGMTLGELERRVEEMKEDYEALPDAYDRAVH